MSWRETVPSNWGLLSSSITGNSPVSSSSIRCNASSRLDVGRHGWEIVAADIGRINQILEVIAMQKQADQIAGRDHSDQPALRC